MFWEDVGVSDRIALSEAGNHRSYLSGELLFAEGEQSTHVIVVRRGRVKITRTSADGNEALLEVRGPGSLLGEMSFFDGRPRSASGWAITGVEALVLPAKRFQPLLAERPDLNAVVLRDLSQRLRQASHRQLESAVGDAFARLAGRLAELADDGVTQPDGSIDVELGLTQQDLADWIGVSREAVVMALRQLRQRGWIETGRKRVRIIDLQQLRAAGIS
ncbi:MAG: Crp/Fnr family transcriptional regulator [Actinomycetota bacterium]